MPITITHHEHPDHVITFDAVSDPDRILITCSCGEDMSLVSDKTPDSALEAVQVTTRHLDEVIT